MFLRRGLFDFNPLSQLLKVIIQQAKQTVSTAPVQEKKPTFVEHDKITLNQLIF